MSPDSPVFRNRLEIARIPPKYRAATLDELVAENAWEKYMLDRARRFLAGELYRPDAAPENWLYFFGDPGTGKTHAVAAIAVECIRRGVWPVRFWPVPDLFKTIIDGFRRDDADARDEYDLALTCALLVLDDIGAERDSPWIIEQLYLLINARDGAGLPTLITSNCSLEELANRLSERAASRIEGRAKPVREIAGRDRRRAPEDGT